MLFMLAAMLRVGWVIVAYDADGTRAGMQYPDEEAYWQVATSLATGQGLRDEFGYQATYMPGYPAFLAVWARLADGWWWARLSQAMLAAAVAPATWLLARTIGQAGAACRSPVRAADRTMERAALLAGLMAAVDPFLVFFSGLLLTEALFAVVLAAAWAGMGAVLDGRHGWALRSAAAGGLLWAGVMLRPSTAILALSLPVVLAIACGWIGRHVAGGWRGFAAGAIMLGVLAVGLLPWAVRNRSAIGEFRWLTTRGGISLYDGVQPGATGGSDLAHTKLRPELIALSEKEWDAWFHAQSRSAIREDPGRIARLAVRKFARTWSIVPNVEAYRRGKVAWISAGWMAGVLLLAAVGLWRLRRAWMRVAVLIWPVVVFTLLHMVFVGSVRYRVPVMPMVFVLAGWGAATLAARRTGPARDEVTR